MSYKALKSFSGVVSMKRGEVKDIKDQEIVKDLLRAGYIEDLGGEKTKTQKSAKSVKAKGGESNA